MKPLGEQFKTISADIDELFSSFETLQEVYKSGIRNIQGAVAALPHTVKSSVSNFEQLISRTDNSVTAKQKQISAKLYNQGLVLVYGSSESLLREMFRSLVKNNLGKVKIKNNVTFTFAEIEQTIGENAITSFEDLVLDKLEDEKSPAEKLNFQNMSQMAGILKGYFDISIDDKELLKRLHYYWQIRHLIIHNAGLIDKKFLDNLKAVEIETKDYEIGKRVAISKTSYEECKVILDQLFTILDEQLSKKKLSLGD